MIQILRRWTPRVTPFVLLLAGATLPVGGQSKIPSGTQNGEWRTYGADLASITSLAAEAHIKGFTTNPTLMRQARVADYKSFALDVLQVVTDRPVSFEVFADDIPGMEAQAHEIASWGSKSARTITSRSRSIRASSWRA